MFKTPTQKRNILVAPLNWGLGHATRCIPVINALIDNDFNPIIASDGIALELLQKEFPNLQTIELPSYKIEYAKNGANFKLKLFLNSHKMIRAILKEKSKTRQIIKEYNIDGIVSDNRLGVVSDKIPSVFITHQLNVMTGNTTWLTTQLHNMIIKKFDECWVPDVDTVPNLSGNLGHPEKKQPNVKYIGPLSRLHKKNLEKKYDLMVILSGPEPQRTMLEEKLISELESYNGTILFVKGKIEDQQIIEKKNQFTYYNYMNSEQIEIAFNESDKVVCRSGYTTVMDLAKLKKKAFFIPTPGQYEQEYLAKKFKEEGLAPSCKQEKFKVKKLEKINLYKGLRSFESNTKWMDLLEIFQ
ncbi:glycosyltransferase [Flavobacterium sp. GCM10023249]|uniref:glycosyltransferase n=1 Tax=unclassified Flavobacterium TaxID=196869 RepID=UPI00361D4765